VITDDQEGHLIFENISVLPKVYLQTGPTEENTCVCCQYTFVYVYYQYTFILPILSSLGNRLDRGSASYDSGGVIFGIQILTLPKYQVLFSTKTEK